MAKQSSRRVMEQRKRDSDRVSFLIDKEGKYLLHAQARREGVSVAEMIRRAILARCGLEAMPNFSMPHYQAIVTADTRESAARAIEGLQLDEYVKHAPADDVYMTVMLSSKGMKEEYIKALLDLLDAIEDIDAPKTAAWTPPTRIKFNKKSLAVVQRLLANIEEMPENDDEAKY